MIVIRFIPLLFLVFLARAPLLATEPVAPPPDGGVFTLTRAEASHFASLALKCVAREYPNKPDHTLNDSSDVQGPRALHPAFYGCLDWHSSVHGHWMLVRLLRLFPDLAEAGRIRAALNGNLTDSNIKAEVTY